jgi:hypothetical protein
MRALCMPDPRVVRENAVHAAGIRTPSKARTEARLVRCIPAQPRRWQFLRVGVRPSRSPSDRTREWPDQQGQHLN